ncbi:PREDICTED: uncharacterized protein LOC105144181 isoform X2 [Acromyrmex echinatior]|nr:PREDICTED: uncharacterized protein LOC105144181 isoform X2 [Acromyrmex echinatior]
MTHYRDSKTHAGHIVLVLGKCSAQMRCANERVSVMEIKKKEKEVERGATSRQNFFLLRSNDRCTQYAPYRAVRPSNPRPSRKKSETQEIARANCEEYTTQRFICVRNHRQMTATPCPTKILIVIGIHLDNILPE